MAGRYKYWRFITSSIGKDSYAGDIVAARVQYAPKISERTSAAIGGAAHLPARWPATGLGNCTSSQLDARKPKKIAGGSHKKKLE